MAHGNVDTPFVEMRSFVQAEPENFVSEAPTPTLASPFVSVYEVDGHPELVDPEQEAYSSLLNELYDEEFDEALFELLVEARGVHQEQLISGQQSIDGERLLSQHFNPLIREAEATVTAFQRKFGARDAASLSEGELDAFADGYSPATNLSPEFENFLGKWKKKIVGFAKKAGKFAMKVGLGPVLDKIKALVKPLLNKVLQMAIGKLPQSVRPLAEQLADRLFNRRPKETGKAAPADAPVEAAPEDSSASADPASAVQAPAGPDVTEIQHEFDLQLANLFLASDEVEMELEIARVRGEERRPAVAAFSDLDEARERFVNELEHLREGEDPAPYIQNFLPAVLPALKLGVKLIGRPKVVGFLAKLLAKVIAKLIGPQAAPALSRAIVDVGLKMMTLEVTPEDEARAAASSVAATVEEAVRRVSSLPDYVLDNQELLEGFALQAFELSAAANLPPVLSDAVYRERPDLLESQNARTGWVMLPLRSRKRYKKCGRTFKVRISPYMANEIESFDGPLADYLQEQLGIEEGVEVEAEVHLYETLPGTTLPDIARDESEMSGVGNGGGMSAAELHPLTPRAAGLLLGEPRMGRHVPPETSRLNVGVGQRLYQLKMQGKRILKGIGKDGKPRPRRSGGLRVSLDCARDEIRICIFLSEVKAQNLAVRIRKQAHPGAMSAAFQKYFAPRLVPILRGERPRLIRVIQAGLTPDRASGAALKRLPVEAAAALSAKLQETVVSAFAEFVKGQSRQFLTAAEDTADGITLKFTIASPAGLREIGKTLISTGQPSGLADTIRKGGKSDVRIDVKPGYACD